MAINIDILNMSKSESEMFTSLFDLYGDVLSIDRSYSLTYVDEAGQEKSEEIALSHDVVRTLADDTQGDVEENFRYALKSKQVGEGASGIVYDVEAKIKKVGRELICKKIEPAKQKGLVVKILKEGKEVEKDEIEIMKRLRTARFKKPVQGKDGITYIVMGKALGRELFDVINDHRTGERRLSDKRILQLGYQLWKALRELHEQGVIHRDLKSENILVDLPDDENAMPVVTIIDFERSKIATRNDAGEIYGTPGFISPETYALEGTSEQSDTFSMGMVIFDLLGVDVKGGVTYDGEYFDYSPLIKSEIPSNTLTTLDDAARLDLYTIHDSITDENPGYRESVDAGINIFDKLLFEQRLAESPDLDEGKMRAAHAAGVLAQNDFREFFPYGEASAKRGIEEVLKDSLKDIKSSEGIKEFITTLEIKQFEGLTSQEEILQKTHKILTEFERLEQLDGKLTALDDRFGALARPAQESLNKAMDQIFADFGKISKKREKYADTLDNMAAYCEKIADRIDSFALRLQDVETKFVVAESLPDWQQQFNQIQEKNNTVVELYSFFMNEIEKASKSQNMSQKRVVLTELMEIVEGLNQDLNSCKETLANPQQITIQQGNELPTKLQNLDLAYGDVTKFINEQCEQLGNELCQANILGKNSRHESFFRQSASTKTGHSPDEVPAYISDEQMVQAAMS